jgi:hypothetical protein
VYDLVTGEVKRGTDDSLTSYATTAYDSSTDTFYYAPGKGLVALDLKTMQTKWTNDNVDFICGAGSDRVAVVAINDTAILDGSDGKQVTYAPLNEGCGTVLGKYMYQSDDDEIQVYQVF